MNRNIGVIIQARTLSTRLPYKILRDLPYGSGIPVLEHVVERLKKAEYIDKIIVATTKSKSDNVVVKIAKRLGVCYFRGAAEDVLARYYFAAKENNLGVILRITADCPCIDPKIVDMTVQRYIKKRSDYTSNTVKRTFPRGLDVEIFNFEALERSYKLSAKDYEREHVTPYIYNNPQEFRISQIKAPKELYAPDIRITLDTEEDYALLCIIFEYLYKSDRFFSSHTIMKLFAKKPWLKLINFRVAQKKICYTMTEEFKEALNLLDFQGLKKAKDILRKAIYDKKENE